MTNHKIKEIKAREILDSRGNPTIEVKVVLSSGVMTKASVPSGASTGSHEAWELRDGDSGRYEGKGVLRAVRNVNTVMAKVLRGIEATRQQDIDHVMLELDGTENKSKLGANAILGVSLAVARAGSVASNLSLYKYLRRVYKLKALSYKLPIPMMNICNGGRHADWALDFQEFMVVPKMPKFRERVRAGAEIFHSLGKVLRAAGYPTLVGDEGGYAPQLSKNEEAFRLIGQAITEAGYRPGADVQLGIDAAASEFYEESSGLYHLKRDGKKLAAREMVELYKDWMEKYPLALIEDGLSEDDWTNWVILTRELGSKMKLVGDDLFVTNVKRLSKGIEMKVANAILIKVNQIGSLTETIDAISLAQKNNYKIAISHRSGETCDTFIADLAVATGAEYIKTGSLSRSERVEKYNRLMEIEEETA